MTASHISSGSPDTDAAAASPQARRLSVAGQSRPASLASR